MTTSKIFVLRVNDANNQSRDGFKYPDGGPISAPDWNPNPVCGGGLHGWEHGIGDVRAASQLYAENARWLVISVEDSPDNLVRLDGKVKFRSGEVLFVGDMPSAAAYIVANGGGRSGMIGASVSAGDMGSATAGYMGSATAGYMGSATAGDEGIIRVAWWDGDSSKYRVKTGIIGETGDANNNALVAHRWYRLSDERKFVEMSALDRIEIVPGDITAQEEWFDVIANAANESLLGGGGVDGAIHAAAGPDLHKFCRDLGGCAVGSAKLSPGFKIRARHIAHAVGPRWQGGFAGESEALASTYRKIMELAIEQRATRIALPSVSTGAFGFPVEKAASIAISTILEMLGPSRIRLVRFVCFDEGTLTAYQNALAKLS